VTLPYKFFPEEYEDAHYFVTIELKLEEQLRSQEVSRAMSFGTLLARAICDAEWQ
jgi:hypothetical protein